MKKFTITLFIIIFSIFSFTNLLSHKQIPTFADSGFDAGYDSYYDSSSWGDSSSDSYWDDDYNYNSGSSYNSNYSSNSGNGSAGFDDFKYMIITVLIVFLFVLVLVFVIKLAIRNGGRLNFSLSKFLYNYFNMQDGYGRNNELIQNAYENYVKIQEAWMNRDLTPVKNLLTDEMYNMYQMQLETLIEDKQINVMSNFLFVAGKIKSTTTHNNIETIKVILCVKCKDYIKKENGRVVSGSKHAKITYIYELTFVRGAKTSETINCPTCGAPVKQQMSATCSHCGNPLLLSSPDLTLSNKKILYQLKD